MICGYGFLFAEDLVDSTDIDPRTTRRVTSVCNTEMPVAVAFEKIPVPRAQAGREDMDHHLS